MDRLISFDTKRRIKKKLRDILISKKKGNKQKVPGELIELLNKNFAEDITLLEKITGRDLSSWRNYQR